jgi:hypothetical protein
MSCFSFSGSSQIEGRVNFDITQEGGTPTEEFSEYVVDKIMPYTGSRALVIRQVGPLEIFKGKLSTTIWILRMLPRGVCDWFFMRLSGIGWYAAGQRGCRALIDQSLPGAVWDSLKRKGWK